MPEVSIVIPSYRGAQRLPRLVRALRAQQGAAWEAVIVIDGVVDDSVDVVERLRGDAPITVLPLAANQGRAAALNAGFAAAAGEVLVRCDDDVEPRADFAAAHHRLHEGRRVGVVGPCEDVFADTAYARAYGRPAELRVREAWYVTPPDEAWRLWSGNVSVTREVYDQVGDYDTGFREYGWEDVDWGYRLHLLGLPVVVGREVEALHHNPATSVRERAERAFASGSSRRRFERKHGPTAAALLASPASWRGPWNVAVGVTAAALNERTLGPITSGLDRLVEHSPRAVGEKLAALGVEAAGRAGRSAG